MPNGKTVGTVTLGIAGAADSGSYGGTCREAGGQEIEEVLPNSNQRICLPHRLTGVKIEKTNIFSQNIITIGRKEKTVGRKRKKGNMREFNYKNLINRTWDNEILTYVAKIHEYKGKQDSYIRQKPVELDRLIEIAKIQSTEASNRIEGIVTTSARLKQLVDDETTPRNRDEKEIMRYRSDQIISCRCIGICYVIRLYLMVDASKPLRMK